MNATLDLGPITPAMRTRMRALYRQGYGQQAIADAVGVSQGTVSMTVNGLYRGLPPIRTPVPRARFAAGVAPRAGR